MTTGRTSGWNSLERAKFGLEVVKLLVGALIAYWVWHLGNDAALKRDQEAASREEDKRIDAQVKAVVDQRLKLWGQVAPAINDIYVYFLRVGSWKELDGQKILNHKRAVDRVMFTNQIMWSPQFFKTYEAFMAASFDMYRGDGKNAGLRTSRQGRPEGPLRGIEFSDEEENRSNVFDRYWAFQKAAADELHVHVPERPDKTKLLNSTKQH